MVNHVTYSWLVVKHHFMNIFFFTSKKIEEGMSEHVHEINEPPKPMEK